MIRHAFCAVIVFVFLSVPVPGDAENGELVLDGGRKGNVPFPHGLHQKTYENCSICHAKF